MDRKTARRLLFQLYDEALTESPVESLTDLIYAERDAVMRFAIAQEDQ